MDAAPEAEEGSKTEELADVVPIYVSSWFVNKDNQSLKWQRLICAQ